jgi:hypothetical protein
VAYSKKAHEQSKAMLNRALELIDDVETTRLQDICAVLSNEFPSVPKNRIRSRAAKALRIARGWAIKGITPHKGGRSERFPSARITKENLEALQSICQQNGESVGDWIERKIKEDAAY